MSELFAIIEIDAVSMTAAPTIDVPQGGSDIAVYLTQGDEGPDLIATPSGNQMDLAAAVGGNSEDDIFARPAFCNTAPTWAELVMQWDFPPAEVGVTDTGRVFSYVLGGITRYRLVPFLYAAVKDSFYRLFIDGVLAGPVAARA